MPKGSVPLKDVIADATSRSQRVKYDHVLTFEIELRFAENVDPGPSKLLATVIDVLLLQTINTACFPAAHYLSEVRGLLGA
jgi:hypothetical protein